MAQVEPLHRDCSLEIHPSSPLPLDSMTGSIEGYDLPDATPFPYNVPWSVKTIDLTPQSSVKLAYKTHNIRSHSTQAKANLDFYLRELTEYFLQKAAMKGVNCTFGSQNQSNHYLDDYELIRVIVFSQYKTDAPISQNPTVPNSKQKDWYGWFRSLQVQTTAPTLPGPPAAALPEPVTNENEQPHNRCTNESTIAKKCPTDIQPDVSNTEPVTLDACQTTQESPATKKQRIQTEPLHPGKK